MISMDQARTLQGKKLLGQGGENLGTIDVLYADREGNEPTFATVNTGMFGSKTSFVPLSSADVQGNDVVVPYDKELVKGAPSIEVDSELSPEEEQRLYSHYGVSGESSYDSGMGTEGGAGTTGMQAGQGTVGAEGTTTQGHDTSGPTTDDAMTRSEERLKVGTQQVETGRARLRKFITTENVQTTVPVSREQVVVEREPITEANKGNALDGPDLSEEEHEVVLHAEQPVVAKETVPVERVKLGTQSVTEQQEVSETVRKEQIETEGAEGTTPRQQ